MPAVTSCYQVHAQNADTLILICCAALLLVGWCRNLVVVNCMVQRGPNAGTRAACGPQTVVVRPANTFCLRYITQSHKYIVLATQPMQVAHH